MSLPTTIVDYIKSKIYDSNVKYLIETALTGETVYSIGDVIKVSTTEKIKNFIAKTGGTEIPVTKSLYDFLLTTDNNYSTTGALDYTAERTVFEISDDTRYEIIGSWIDITPFTNTATITFQFYRSVAAAGGTYRKAGDTITKVVGTDNPVIEFADWAHYGYTKITAVSDNAGDNSVDVPFGYIKKPLE